MAKKLLITLTTILAVLILIFIFVPAPDRENETGDNEPLGSTTNSPNIRVFNVQAGEVIDSPLVVLGEARLWYFEASFPVRLEDAEGKLIVQGFAQAKSDWMTEEFVTFESKLEFEAPATKTGFLVLEEDDPSGQKTELEFMKIPVTFKGQS